MLRKYQETRRGDPLGTLKVFRKKSRTMPKKPKGTIQARPVL